MARLIWGATPREADTGLDRGVLYPANGPGVPWNGLISVTENPPDSKGGFRYIDGVRVRARRTAESFSAVIEALSYPDELYRDPFMGSRIGPFGLSYRVQTTNAHKIHLVYNAQTIPAAREYLQEQSLSPYLWAIDTKPVPVPEGRPSAHLVVDTAKAHASVVEALEYILYGSDEQPARLPTPAEVVDIFEENAILRVTDHGDGTFTVTGPDEAIVMLDLTTFQITWDSALIVDENSYTISSL